MEKARKVLDIYGEYDTLREIYYDGQGYMEAWQIEELDHFVPDPNMAEYMRSTRTVGAGSDGKVLSGESGHGQSAGLLRLRQGRRSRLFGGSREIEGVEATGALPYNIEVNAGGINKGEALLWLAGELGIRTEKRSWHLATEPMIRI